MSLLIDKLRTLSAAEEFFDFLEVPYDKSVLNVCRLHIMRRMGQYLRGEDLDGLSDAEALPACREILARAYADFTHSTPLQEKVFKVFKDQAEARAGQFVSLDSLTIAPVSDSRQRT
jgi:nitrogenase-stabilizing/protective protein